MQLEMLAMETSAKRFVVVLLMTQLIARHHPSSAVRTDADGRLRYLLTEQQPVDTLVANVAGDAGLSTDDGDARYVLINNNEQTTRLFRIDGDGLLRTSDVVDRDVLCPQQPACSVLLDAAVQRGSDVRIIKIHIEIIDLNDNAPLFAEPETEFHLAEPTPPGILFPLPVAADPDSPLNGVIGYRLSPESDVFGVRVQNLSTGDLDVRLVLYRLLDRQRKDRYTFSLIAFDGGQPQLSGSIVVKIFVEEVRQYLPRFDRSSYEAQVRENSPAGSIVIRLHASAAPRATITYSFSRRTQVIYGTVFAINSTTGIITLLGAVDRASYNLSVEAAVEGSNSVPARAALTVLVQFVNDRPPTVTVDTLTDSGQATVRGDTPPGTFVAHISASDPNRGANGHVTCLLDGYGDDFRLVRMFEGEYKMLTQEYFDVVGVVVVPVSCQDHGDPPLSTVTNISVTITAPHGVNNPVFTQPTYNATLSSASHAPVFVIQVTAAEGNSSSESDISYSFAQTYPEFSIGRTSGVVRMVATPFETSTAELVVVATAAGGGSSRATVYMSVVRPEQLLFFEKTVACRVREDADPGTSVCSLAEAEATLAADRCLYYDLVDAADDAFRVDPISGIIYTNGTLDSELTPRFRLTARVQLDTTPTRVVNVLIDVDVEDVNDCLPQFVFPFQDNNTVFVDITTTQLSTSGTLHVTVVSARDGDAAENGRVSFSIVANNSDSQYFTVAPSTGEVCLNVVDRQDDLINRSFVLYIAATDHGRPPLQSVAALYIVLHADNPISSSKHSEVQSDAGLMILAGVLCSFFVVALIIGIAIFVVCRKSKRRRPQLPINGDLFCGRIKIESSEDSRSTSSVPIVSPVPTTNDIGRTVHSNTVTVDTGLDYLQRYKSGIENPVMTSQQVRGGGDSEQDDDDSGCAGFSNSSSDDGADSKHSSEASDIGGSTDLPGSARHSQPVDVPEWLQGTSFRASSSGGAILRRASSTCSRKSVRFADSDVDASNDAKKHVHFAPVHRYVGGDRRDVTSGDDVTDAGGDGASEMSFTNSDCSSGLYVVNCGGYHVGGAAGDSRPPIVAFRTFLPSEGSLV